MNKQESVFKVSYTELKANTTATTDRGVTIANVMFDDPSSRNSFRVSTSRELLKLLPQIEKLADVMVFRSTGRVFCSGGNLKDHIAQGAVKSRSANREITKCLARLSALEIPTVAVVRGDAFGGGLELLSAFDVVIAAPHVLLGFWQRRLGLSFGWGGGARFVKRVTSPARLVGLALEARALTASEALRHGIVDRVAASWAIEGVVQADVVRMATLSDVSVRALKGLKAVTPVEARREQSLFEKIWYGPVHRAFLSSKKR